MTDKLAIDVDAQIAALVPRFLANRAADVVKIRTALAARDFDTIRQAAHSMKGSGTGYGFPEITSLGAAMEESARLQEAAATMELVTRLEDFLVRLDGARGGCYGSG